jgi:hypothetical protein
MSIINFDVPNNDVYDNEEYVMGMPCENAILDDHDDTLLQESPIVFLNFSITPSRRSMLVLKNTYVV